MLRERFPRQYRGLIDSFKYATHPESSPSLRDPAISGLTGLLAAFTLGAIFLRQDLILANQSGQYIAAITQVLHAAPERVLDHAHNG
jgi:hypothetical protein